MNRTKVFIDLRRESTFSEKWQNYLYSATRKVLVFIDLQQESTFDIQHNL